MRLIKHFALTYLYAQLEGSKLEWYGLDNITSSDTNPKNIQLVASQTVVKQVKTPRTTEPMPELGEGILAKLAKGTKATQFADVTVADSQTDFDGNVMTNIPTPTDYPMQYGADGANGCGLKRGARSRRRRQAVEEDEDQDEKSWKYMTWEEKKALREEEGYRMFNGARPGNMNNHPWNAYIVIALADSQTTGTWYHCGGAVINQEWILTTASCLDSANRDIAYMKVIVGVVNNKVSTLNGRVNNNNWGSATHAVARWIVHANYQGELNNDIALLQLESDAFLDVTDKTQDQYPVCLPKSTTCLNADDGINLEVGGWGANHQTNNYVQQKFMRGQVPLRKWGDCNWWIANYYSTSAWMHHITWMDAGEMCAGGKPASNGGNVIDPCEADAGSPLVYQDDNNVNTVLGLTSWGIDVCGPDTSNQFVTDSPYITELHHPTVYTRVSKYLDWIKQNSGVYMVGDTYTVTDAYDGSTVNAFDVECHESGIGQNFFSASPVRDDSPDFGFATGTSNAVVSDITDGYKHIWSANNFRGCLAKARRKDSTERRVGKYLMFVQRCDQVRDVQSHNGYWNSNFQFEFQSDTGYIVQTMDSLWYGYDTEFCVMLTKKSVSIAKCDTPDHIAPRDWSQFEYLSDVGAFITTDVWENQPNLNYRFRVLYYPTYMTFFGGQRYNLNSAAYEPGYRRGEMHMKHGPFKFSAWQMVLDDTGTYETISNAATDFQWKMNSQLSAKLMGNSDDYCAKVFSEDEVEEEVNWGGQRIKMVPCGSGDVDDLKKGSWRWDPSDGYIYFHHDDAAVSSKIGQVCLYSRGTSSALETNTCSTASADRKRFYFSGTVTTDEKETFQGLMANNLYWGSKEMTDSTVQCVYVAQKSSYLYVATCRDMNYSFGNSAALAGGEIRSTRSSVKNTDPWEGLYPAEYSAVKVQGECISPLDGSTMPSDGVLGYTGHHGWPIRYDYPLQGASGFQCLWTRIYYKCDFDPVIGTYFAVVFCRNRNTRDWMCVDPTGTYCQIPENKVDKYPVGPIWYFNN